ncbi:class I SAM-dependent methyltransferase, partial [Candidatus Daviesbacteria bacterium]|nr:class I SAM-dependent methyltransferase [Candidatus Daviesbacteria bacterium]
MTNYNQQYFAELEKADKLEKPRNLRLLELVEKYQTSGNFLDIGVGSGLMLKLSRRHGFKTYGVDVSEYAIARLKKIVKAKLFCGDLKDLNLPKNFFDVINMRHSIEHLKDPQNSLKEVFKLLKPGGIICIATPNSFGLHAKLYGQDWPHLSLPYHLHFFSKQSLKDLVISSGFEILDQKTEELTNYYLFKLFLFK